MENIKPCPICGEALEVVYIGGGWFWRHKIDPPYPLCPITYSRKYSTREETIREINKRADDNLVSPKKEKIEDLKSEIRKHLSQIDCDNAEIKFLKNHMEVLSEVIDKLQLEVETARSDARNEFAEEIYNFFCIEKNWSKLKEQWLEDGSCPWLAKTINNLANGESISTSNNNKR